MFLEREVSSGDLPVKGGIPFDRLDLSCWAFAVCQRPCGQQTGQLRVTVIPFTPQQPIRHLGTEIAQAHKSS